MPLGNVVSGQPTLGGLKAGGDLDMVTSGGKLKTESSKGTTGELPLET